MRIRILKWNLFIVSPFLFVKDTRTNTIRGLLFRRPFSIQLADPVAATVAYLTKHKAPIINSDAEHMKKDLVAVRQMSRQYKQRQKEEGRNK